MSEVSASWEAFDVKRLFDDENKREIVNAFATSGQALHALEQFFAKLETQLCTLLGTFVSLDVPSERLANWKAGQRFIEIRLRVFQENMRVLLPVELACRITEKIFPREDGPAMDQPRKDDITALSYLVTKLLAMPEMYNTVRAYLCSVDLCGDEFLQQDWTNDDGCLEFLWKEDQSSFSVAVILGEELRARIYSYAKLYPGWLPRVLRQQRFQASLTLMMPLVSLGSLLLAERGDFLPFSPQMNGCLQTETAAGEHRAPLFRNVAFELTSTDEEK